MRFLKEPFTHFALLGVAIFAWFTLLNPDAIGGPDENEIIVDEQLVSALGSQFRARMNRNPSQSEAEAIIDQHIRHEVLAREALELGLDRGDGIVRNRLVQKMQFLSTSVAQSATPDDETLQEYMMENAAQYTTEARMSFEQVVIEEGTDERTMAEMLVALRNGEEPSRAGGPILLPGIIRDSHALNVDGTFGRGFFERVAGLPVDTWSGPVQSGYGLHFVRLEHLQAAEPPQLETVRDDVLFDWRRDLGQEMAEAHEAGLMEDYEITRPTPEEIEAWMTQ